MASKGIRPLPEFNPSEGAACWEDYKRDFQVHLDALGLDDKPGRRKVGVLLANMGRECVKIYDSFAWSPAVEANEKAGIEAVPAEDKHNLETVFGKFDRHFGVHSFRNIKRQEFLNTKRGNLSIMDYIAELKRKAEQCQYGEQKEGLICDMIINGVNDTKCSEKLMEIPAGNLTIERVMQLCCDVKFIIKGKDLKLDCPGPNTVRFGNTIPLPPEGYEERGFVVDIRRCRLGLCFPQDNIHSLRAHRETEGNGRNQGAGPVLPKPALPFE